MDLRQYIVIVAEGGKGVERKREGGREGFHRGGIGREGQEDKGFGHVLYKRISTPHFPLPLIPSALHPPRDLVYKCVKTNTHGQVMCAVRFMTEVAQRDLAQSHRQMADLNKMVKCYVTTFLDK